VNKMAIKTARIVKSSVLRVACAGAFGAAIIIAPVVGISAGPLAGSSTVAAPCTQVNMNGSISLQCGVSGTQGYGGYGGYGGCVTQYGTYQNCIAQRGD
jgi:hypothetical protein